MRKIAELILALAVAGCVTPPKVHNFDKSRSFHVSKDEAWLNVIEFFTNNSLQIKTIEKESGIIYAESGGFDSRFADCGAPGLAIPIQNSGEFNVFVRDRGFDTEVVVNTTYRQVRQFGQYPPYVVNCYSTGFLEQLVLESAGESAGIVQPSRGPTETSSPPRTAEAAARATPRAAEATAPATPRIAEVAERPAPRTVEVDARPPAPPAEVSAAAQPADPCARYENTPTESRCRLYASPNGWQLIPPAGRNADLDTQLRCAPVRSSATSYERCISGTR